MLPAKSSNSFKSALQLNVKCDFNQLFELCQKKFGCIYLKVLFSMFMPLLEFDEIIMFY